MNPRERILAVVVGVAIAVGLGYKGVRILFIEPINKHETAITNLENKKRELIGLLDAREGYARRWLKRVGRTFSFEKTEAQGLFGKDLKEIAKRHGFGDAVVSPSSGTKIGHKTDIITVAHRISVEGEFGRVIAFLRDVYATPYLCQITKLTLSPLGRKGGRNAVKLDFTVETPLLPEVDPKQMPYVANARPMPARPDKPLGPARKHLRGDEYYSVLADRNIFRSYLPPPENLVMIENQDRKPVFLKINFLWDGQVYERLVKSVTGKTSKEVKGKGDVVEITGSYADGEAFGPKRFDFGRKQNWTYVVPSHTPPTVVDLAVDNQDDDVVYLEVVVMLNDNQRRTEPTMVFDPGVSDLRAYKDVKSVKVSAKYASGKHAQPKTFTPKEGRQTFEVPVEPVVQVAFVDENDKPIEDVDDLPADPAFTVTGLVYYPDKDGRWHQEMIVNGNGQRRIIRVGDVGEVDGGTLTAIVPALGGVVQMPETGNYYIYPLESRFTGRVRLDARVREDLPAAIDAWTRQ
jgi:hypothetical protein